MGIVESVAGRALQKIFDDIAASRRAHRIAEATKARLQDGINSHVFELERWSAHISAFGLVQSASTSTDRSTVPITISSLPRRFRAPETTAETKPEAYLLDTYESFLILGDPGSGKTTTIKRLVRRVLQEEPISSSDQIAFPIVGVLREMPRLRTVAEIIMHCLDLDAQGLCDVVGKHLPESDEGTARKRALARAAAVLLDQLQGCLFLDGLDEVIENRTLREDLVTFTRLLQRSKVIVSCRSGDYRQDLEALRPVELCPLSRQQVVQIAEFYLGARSSAFLSTMSPAARELTDRPLFVLQMLLLFERSGSIPERPAMLCRALLRASLQDWDEQRRIVRRSRYGDFDIDRKLEFLGSLAYELLVARGIKHFTTNALESAYGTIHARFGLPANEAREVVAEIETHTGIVVQSGSGFEFSHLSLQEYLAADYLARLPGKGAGSALVQVIPAVVAVAVSISADPSAFFAETVLNSEDGTAAEFYSLAPGYHRIGGDKEERYSHRQTLQQSFVSFLTRTLDENPIFRESEAVGFAVLRLLKLLPDEAELVLRLLNNHAVRSSTKTAIQRYYDWNETRNGTLAQVVRRYDCSYPKAPEDTILEPAVAELLRPDTPGGDWFV